MAWILLGLALWVGAAVLIGKCIALGTGAPEGSPWRDAMDPEADEANLAFRREAPRVRFSKLG